MYKILFVCTGNICRSPTAEGVMRRLVKEAGLGDEVFVDSAGTSGYHSGDCPDLRAVICASGHGTDISSLRSRAVRAEDFAEFDLILAMDNQNIWDLDMKRPEGDPRYQRARILKLLSYAPEFGDNIPDPYYDSNGFEAVYTMIETACRNLLQTLYPHSER